MTIDIENGIGLGCYAWADLDSFKDFRMNFISWLLSKPGTGSHFLCNTCKCFFWNALIHFVQMCQKYFARPVISYGSFDLIILVGAWVVPGAGEAPDPGRLGRRPR